MEEILASIKRVIAEDSRAPQPAPRPRKGAVEEVKGKVLKDQLGIETPTDRHKEKPKDKPTDKPREMPKGPLKLRPKVKPEGKPKPARKPNADRRRKS